MTEIDYKKATELDPLNIDADLAHLPEYNAEVDTRTLCRIGQKAIHNFRKASIEKSEEAYAVLRDLDFIASSLDRHGLDPMKEVEGLEDAMIWAGFVGDSAPRGTITTYAGMNPDGERRRSFTGSKEEALFIDSLKISFDELEVATNSIARLTSYSKNGAFIHSLDTSTSAMQTMTNSTVAVMRNIPPTVFTGEIRPYFEPLKIGGKSYVAANGSQLQLVGIEKMVYGTGGVDSIESDFYEENLPYLNSVQRQQLHAFAGANDGQSLLTMIEARRREGEDISDVLVSLAALTKTIRKFRYPHRKVAEDNFKLRPDGSVGSGSYTPAVLTDLIHTTEVRIAHVQEMSA